MHSLESIEKKQNIKFTEEYKRLYQSNFKQIDNRKKFHVGDDVFCISKFLTATEINDILDEFYNILGYDLIPIAQTDDDDYICLNYIENMKKPSIVLWNYELALENAEEGILFLYNSFYEFEALLME